MIPVVAAILIAAAPSSTHSSPHALASTHGVWVIAAQGTRVRLLDVAFREVRTAPVTPSLEAAPIVTVAAVPPSAPADRGLAFAEMLVPFDNGWVVAQGENRGPFVPTSLHRLADDGKLSPPLYTFTGKLGFVAPSEDGRHLVLGYWEKTKLSVVVLDHEGKPARAPVVALERDSLYTSSGGVAIGVPGGFLIASGVGGEALPGRPLDILHVGLDGAVAHVDSIPQSVLSLSWCRDGRRSWLLVAADEGTFAVPFGFDGKQSGKPLVLDPKPFTMLAGTVHAGVLSVVAGNHVAPIVMLERDTTSSHPASSRIIDPGSDWQPSVAWAGDRAYIVWSHSGGASFVTTATAR